MVAFIVACSIAVAVALAELLHIWRCRRLGRLAFGPHRRSSIWVFVAPALRIASIAAVAWGLVTLMSIEPRVHRAGEIKPRDIKHVVLILDVSPSMRLDDAGPESDQSRVQRASDVLESFFKRVPLEQYRISVVAVYNGAKPVVIDTRDIEVVRNILNDLPMHYAFPVGKTTLFAGLDEAAKIAKPWQPGSTTILMITDGDTVPAKGMPRMPASIRDVVVIGVGDPSKGRFIDGRQSRQETSVLNQIANRLNGTYHNGNEKHLSSSLIADLTKSEDENPWEQLSLREYALIAIVTGSSILALLPLLLHFAGTLWMPGVRRQKRQANSQSRAWQA